MEWIEDFYVVLEIHPIRQTNHGNRIVTRTRPRSGVLDATSSVNDRRKSGTNKIWETKVTIVGLGGEDFPSVSISILL